MRRLVILACALAGGALSACGGGDAPPPKHPVHAGRPYAFDPVPDMLACLAGRRVPAHRTSAYEVSVGDPRYGMRIRFAPTPADADATQLRGKAEGAEIARRILFFVGTAPDPVLAPVEECVNDIGDKYS
jgi:hypothetical protein